MTSNTQLQEQVLDELHYEPSVDASEIGVTANDGIVSLTGKVKSYAENYAAVRAAQRVYGVRAVTNEMEVDLPAFHQRDDQDRKLAGHGVCIGCGCNEGHKRVDDQRRCQEMQPERTVSASCHAFRIGEIERHGS